MATSGTYSFDPSLGELIITAFGRVGIRRTELVASYMLDGRMAANMVLVEFANRQPNLWTVGLTALPLVDGTATYTLNANIVMVLDLYINNTHSDRVLAPISRTEYASIPNKTLQSTPTQFWFNRQVVPTLTFWPVPDSNGPYTAYYYAVRQTQDAELPVGQTVEIPFRFLDAFVAHLAWKLAEIYKPELETTMMAKAERAWNIASTQDQEHVPIYMTPDLSRYWRE
jgi:hypothetical protein